MLLLVISVLFGMNLSFSFGLLLLLIQPFALVIYIIIESMVLIFYFSIMLRCRFFQVLVLLELGVLLFIYGKILEGVCLFRVLLVFVLGACESSIGLGVSVALGRAKGVSSFGV